MRVYMFMKNILRILFSVILCIFAVVMGFSLAEDAPNEHDI